MFTIRFRTTAYRPDLQVTIRNSVDGWDDDVPGIYEDDEWRFELSEARYPNGIEFKFVLERTYWMAGENLFLHPADGGDYVFSDSTVRFPPMTEVLVENSYFQQVFFPPNLDEGHLFDVIVVGSGVGGGIVAEQLADLGADVLVLEAGSLLFPTHIANLPRQHQVGKFDKHLWGLFDEFRVVNYEAPDSNYEGGQTFNLGGRSVFWGGFIPRMTWWELEPWPEPVRWHLENAGYQRAEDLMYWPAPPARYQQEVKMLLKNRWPDFDHFDAPMAVRHLNPSFGTISTGLFSTADLLTESRLTVDPSGKKGPSINLNHAVVKLETSGNRISGVVARDLLVNRTRSFRARHVVLAAGTVESPKIARLSGLHDPRGLVGAGITDHPIFFTHFSVPQGRTWHRVDASSKTLSRHTQASAGNRPYNILLELGADLNQGRYLDPDTLDRHRQLKGDAMLCEVVFLFNAPLVEQNRLEHTGPSYAKPVVRMQDSPAADGFLAEVNEMKDQIIGELGGEAIAGGDLSLKRAPLGGVAHEVGTLRMGAGDTGVVDEDLRFNGYDNLFVCDLSVFPTSPAANPTLTLAALSLRLADHLRALG